VIEVAETVRQALAEGRAVVALETTVLSHGLPRPANLETALAMESAIRASGATPASVGLVSGCPIIGLSVDELELLATSAGVVKVSRRDLPVVVARRQHGATTVAGTLCLMASAGLEVLATGGLGGVHRGAERTFDVSADLAELARSNALVVCSGAKAILDLPRTVELLESLGVTLLGYQTAEFPAFFLRSSGLPVSATVEEASEAARMTRARRNLGLAGAVVLGVPAPSEQALDMTRSDQLFAQAEQEAAAAGVSGKALTPFLLDRLAHLSEGRSLAANVALLVNNARVAAEAAIALASMA
jgi:pseudouridine-5'-phosphate glycosidase